MEPLGADRVQRNGRWNATPVRKRRERNPEQTRRTIIQAARRLFARDGYRATTVQAVAREAGVSPQTIYDSFGSKAALIGAMNDHITTEAGVPALYQTLTESTDPEVLIRLPFLACRQIVERCGDIARATSDATRGEPELREVRLEATRRRREAGAILVRKLATLGTLPPDADLDAVTDTVATFADTALWFQWIDEYGWDLDRAEAYALQTTRALLFGGDGAIPAPPGASQSSPAPS